MFKSSVPEGWSSLMHIAAQNTTNSLVNSPKNYIAFLYPTKKALYHEASSLDTKKATHSFFQH